MNIFSMRLEIGVPRLCLKNLTQVMLLFNTLENNLFDFGKKTKKEIRSVSIHRYILCLCL